MFPYVFSPEGNLDIDAGDGGSPQSQKYPHLKTKYIEHIYFQNILKYIHIFYIFHIVSIFVYILHILYILYMYTYFVAELRSKIVYNVLFLIVVSVSDHIVSLISSKSYRTYRSYRIAP